MKALLYLEPGRMQIADMPIPALADGDVLIKTAACGVCATDVKTFMRGHALIPRGSVLGHEMTGVIVATRNPAWREGERVVVPPYTGCGECHACKRHKFSMCERLFENAIEPGGFAEYFRAPQRLLKNGARHLNSQDDLTMLALAEPLACCIHGFAAMDMRPGDSVLIIGDGPMGLMQAALARHLGASCVALSGLTPERLEWARPRVDHVIDASKTDVREASRDLGFGEGFDMVMLSIANPEAAGTALALARRGGSVNLFAGLPRNTQLSLDSFRIHYDEVKLVGTFGFGAPDFARAAELLSSGALDLNGYITRTVTLEELPQAFADSAAYRGIKTVAVFGEASA